MGPARWARSIAAAVAVALAALEPSSVASAAFEFEWPDARSASLLVPETARFAFPSGAAEFGNGPRSARSVGPVSWSISLSSGELYGLPEASGWSARALAATREGAVALRVSSFGGDLYREGSFGVSVSRSVGGGLELASSGRLLTLTARGVGPLWSFALDLAARRRFLGRVVVDVSADNVGGARIGGSAVGGGAVAGVALEMTGVRLRYSTSFGQTWTPASTVSCEVGLGGGLRLRVATCTEPARFAFGLGLGTPGRAWPMFDAAWQWHPRLGGSVFATVTFGL